MSFHSEAAQAPKGYMAQSITRRSLRSFETSFKRGRQFLDSQAIKEKDPPAIAGGSSSLSLLLAIRYSLRIGTKTNGGGSGRFGGGPSSGGPSATSLASLPPPKSFASLPSTKAVLAIVSFAVE